MDGKRRPAVDENGDIYVVTGNGPYNPQFALDQLGESVVHLIWNPGNPGSLVVADILIVKRRCRSVQSTCGINMTFVNPRVT